MSRPPVDTSDWLGFPDNERPPRRKRWPAHELTADDYARLLHLRSRIALGRVSEGPPTPPRPSRRWCFYQLMFRHGVFSDYD